MRGRIVVVTGASEGIGRATTLKLTSMGAHVILCARREAPLMALVEEIRVAGGTAEAVCLDVADLDKFAALIAETGRKHGRLDGLVNNAMSVTYKSLLDLEITDWRRDFAVNAEAVFIGTREALRIMIPQRRGSVVNVSSACGTHAMAGVPSYSASKAALIHFSACAAIEAAPFGVRVNCVVPGQIDTPATKAFAAAAPDKGVAITKAIPMLRSGEPEEVADVITFLLSDGSTYITGVAIPVDGGKAKQLYIPGWES